MRKVRLGMDTKSSKPRSLPTMQDAIAADDKGGEKVKLCKRGHERLPNNVMKNGTCKLCNKLRNTEWRKNNSELALKRDARYRKSDADGVKRRQQKYVSKNIEKVREIARSYARRMRVENPKLLYDRTKRWQLEHKDKISQYNKKRTANLPDYLVANKLQIKLEQAPSEVIEIKRMTIQLKRRLKENG